MFDTECRGCGHAKGIGFFLYCALKGYRPAKRKCEHFWVRITQTQLKMEV